MNGDDLTRQLRWYPPEWRARYGDELAAYMQDTYGDRRPPLRDRLSLVTGGVRERARRGGLLGTSAPPSERVRAGALSVLAAWAAFVLAGCSFAKLSEHFDNALPGGIDNPGPPGGSHHVPDVAYALVQNLAAAAAIAVLCAAVLALPALVRFLRRGGWLSLRSHVRRALVATCLTCATMVPLVVWAHGLTNHQRNGGLPGYTALFLAWAALFALSVILWTAVAVAAARRVTLSRPLLLTEAAAAVALTAVMLVIVGAVGVWWAAIASNAPRFIATGAGAAPVNAQLAGTVLLMVLAAATAAWGSVRIARSWRGAAST